ncbi:MAG TPA: hypothetical protein VI755_10515, partial [Anaerolineales bacterium]|nr:hypothetical protein [Anaerolineales bacterium]
MFLSDVADRDPRAQWQERGGLDAQARALRRARDILTRDNPAVFSPEVDARVRAAFIGMVAGDSLPPEGWKRVVPSTEPEGESGLRRRRRHHERVPG